MYIRSIHLRDACFEEEYLYHIPAIRDLSTLDFSKHPVTFLVGENGSGKSTLLEAIAVAAGFNPEGGSKNLRFSSMDTHSSLHRNLRLIRSPVLPKDGYFLRAESFYNMASSIDRLDEGTGDLAGAYGGRSLHHQSHGESFLSLVLNRLGGNGLYLFDEPEAALSPARQLTLLCALHQLVEDNSQFIIATHSPILMAYPGATIYLFNEEGIKECAYTDTEHYSITKSFLENPERMLRILFDAD